MHVFCLNYCREFYVKRAFFAVFALHYKRILRFASEFGFF